jgi:hypothetical protein
MIESNELIKGNTYFLLLYYDHDLKIPDIKSIIYVGNHKTDGNNDKSKMFFLFQDPKSFVLNGMVDLDTNDQDADNEILHRFDEDMLFSIYTWSGLIDELARNKEAQDNGIKFD